MDNLPIAFVVIIAILAAMLVWYLRDPKLVAEGAAATGSAVAGPARKILVILLTLGAIAAFGIVIAALFSLKVALWVGIGAAILYVLIRWNN